MSKLDALTIVNEWNRLTISGVEIHLELEDNVLKVLISERGGNLLLDVNCYYKYWDAFCFATWLVKAIREICEVLS